MSLSKIAGKIALASTTALAAVSPILAQSYRTTTTYGSNAGLDIFTLCCWALICLLILVGFVGTIYLIIDATKRDYGTDSNMMIIGILLILFLGFPFGWFLYAVLIMNKYPKKA